MAVFRREILEAVIAGPQSGLSCRKSGNQRSSVRACLHPPTRYLYRVVGARYQQGSIVLCANTGFSRWKSLFPSEETAVATVDRLIDRATRLSRPFPP